MLKKVISKNSLVRYFYPKQWDWLIGRLSKLDLRSRRVLGITLIPIVLLVVGFCDVRVGDPPRTPLEHFVEHFVEHFLADVLAEPKEEIQPMAQTKLSDWAKAVVSNYSQEYLLFLEFEVRFRSENFNDVRTLHSLEPHGDRDVFWHRDFSTSSEMARWTSVGRFDTLPEQLTIPIGGEPWSVLGDQIQWEELEVGDTTSLIGGATVKLVLDDPNWIVLSDAILHTTDSPTEWVLEFQLRNRTESAMIGKTITLESELMVFCSGEYQSIALDWNANPEWSVGSGPLSAVTNPDPDLKDLKVTAHVDFYPSVSCNEHDVTVRVPTSITMNPNSLMDYFLKMEEIEVSEEDSTQMANSPDAKAYRLPPKLPRLRNILSAAGHLHGIWISVDGAFPSRLQVTRFGRPRTDR